jgi:hypothetical protein
VIDVGANAELRAGVLLAAQSCRQTQINLYLCSQWLARWLAELFAYNFCFKQESKVENTIPRIVDYERTEGVSGRFAKLS